MTSKPDNTQNTKNLLKKYFNVRSVGRWAFYLPELVAVADWWEGFIYKAVKERPRKKQLLKEEIANWVKTFPESYREETRAEYLANRLKEKEMDYIQGNEKAIDEIYRIHNEREGRGITDEMIQKAREYPIGELIELKNGFALCPFHEEKTPSAYCKNNFFHCFGCGKNLDTIGLYMELNQVNFIQAVKNLQ